MIFFSIRFECNNVWLEQRRNRMMNEKGKTVSAGAEIKHVSGDSTRTVTQNSKPLISVIFLN